MQQVFQKSNIWSKILSWLLNSMMTKVWHVSRIQKPTNTRPWKRLTTVWVRDYNLKLGPVGAHQVGNFHSSVVYRQKNVNQLFTVIFTHSLLCNFIVFGNIPNDIVKVWSHCQGIHLKPAPALKSRHWQLFSIKTKILVYLDCRYIFWKLLYKILSKI